MCRSSLWTSVGLPGLPFLTPSPTESNSLFVKVTASQQQTGNQREKCSWDETLDLSYRDSKWKQGEVRGRGRSWSCLGLQQCSQGPVSSPALGARQAGSPSHRLNLRLGAVVLAISQHQTDPFLGTEKNPSLGSSGSLGEGHNPQRLASGERKGAPYTDSLPFVLH